MARGHADDQQRLLGGNVSRPQDVLLTRFDAAALVPVLQGRQYLLVHVERASDILQVLALKRNSRACAWSWSARRGLDGRRRRSPPRGVPVIASRSTDLPDTFEQLASTQSNVGRMRAPGVARLDRHDRRRGIAAGAAREANMPAISSPSGGCPARPASAGRRRWRRSPRRRPKRSASAARSARFAPAAAPTWWSGTATRSRTAPAPVLVLIDGVQQPLANHQTELRDRYRSLAPKATCRTAYDPR